MAYPTGIKIYVDGVDCTYNITGEDEFNPDVDNNTFRDIDITPFLRKPMSYAKMVDRNYKGDASNSDLHTIEITALDGNGRVECRVEVR